MLKLTIPPNTTAKVMLPSSNGRVNGFAPFLNGLSDLVVAKQNEAVFGQVVGVALRLLRRLGAVLGRFATPSRRQRKYSQLSQQNLARRVAFVWWFGLLVLQKNFGNGNGPTNISHAPKILDDLSCFGIVVHNKAASFLVIAFNIVAVAVAAPVK